MLTPEEILQLDTVLIKDNKSLNYVSFSGGWGGAGNTNTTSFQREDSKLKPIASYAGVKLVKPRSGSRCEPQIAAAVEDALYVIAHQKVYPLHLYESYTERVEIAYDTYQMNSIVPVSEQIVTGTTEQGTYTGTVVGGLPEGKGSYLYFENDPFGRKSAQGFFLAGKMVRHGTIRYRDGSCYEGIVKDDLPHTFHGGKYTYPNGEYYVGAFENGLPHGSGVLFDASGEVKHNGWWRNGEISK